MQDRFGAEKKGRTQVMRTALFLNAPDEISFS